MKNKILKPLVLFFSITLLFVNCQKDDDFKDLKIDSKSSFKFNNLSLKDLQQKKNLQQSLNKISKNFDVNKSKSNKGDSSSRLDAEDGSFTILTEEIYEVTTDSSVTYSFKIETPILQTSSFENFILEIKNDTVINYYISSYQLISNPQEEDFPYTISFLPVDENLINIENLNTQLNNRILSVFSGGCTYLFETTDDCACNGGSALILLDSWCGGGGGSASSGTGNSGTSSSGGGGGSTGNNTTTNNFGLGAPMAVNNTPSDKEKVIECLENSGTTITPAQLAWLNINDQTILNIIKRMASRINKSKCHVMADIILAYLEDTTQNFDEFVENELECYGVQDLLDDTNFMNALNTLPSQTSEDEEYGYAITRTNGTINSGSMITGDWNGIELGNGGDIIGGQHTHTAIGYPMFSAADIYTLFNFYLKVVPNQTVSQHDVFLTLTTQGANQTETYMIKIKDFTMLRSIIQQYELHPSNRRAMRNFDIKLSSGYTSNNANTNMRELLQTFEAIKSEFNMPSSALYLYKLNSSNNTFEKVQLDGSNSSNPPIKTPCN